MKKNNQGFIQIIIILVVIVLVGGAYYFGKVSNKSDVVIETPTKKPVVIESNKPIIGPTTEWKTYSNSKHNISFKFPSTWKLDRLNENDDYNANPRLIKDRAIIQFYINMDGIGGAGNDYVGTPIVVGGINLFKYESENTFGKTKQIGVTDTLTKSLGFFRYQNKTYSIFLTYPIQNISESEINDLKSDFNQILSTFKFTQ